MMRVNFNEYHQLGMRLRLPADAGVMVHIQDRGHHFMRALGGNLELGAAQIFPDVTEPGDGGDGDDTGIAGNATVGGSGPRVFYLAYELRRSLKVKLASLGNPCVQGEAGGGDFGRCVEEYIEERMGCRYPRKTGSAHATGLRDCGESADAARLSDLRELPLDQLGRLSGCRWSCSVHMYGAKLEDRRALDSWPEGGDIPEGFKDVLLYLMTSQTSTAVLREYEVYGASAFVADVGSYLGLLLGASLFDAYDLILSAYETAKAALYFK